MKAATVERAGAAVVIGVGDYLHQEQVWPLRYAARDAEAMAGVLSDPEICGFPDDKVKLLTNQSASRDAVAHHLSRWLPEQARGAEIAVIYFAGHGMIHRVGRRDDGYLLPYDAEPDDIVTRGVLMADLARWIDAIDVGTVIVCLDCCHAAKVIPRGLFSSESPARDMRIRPALLEALTGRGRFLIASCGDGQVSVETEAWGHGLFTYHLLEGIRGAGDRDGNGHVGVTELFEYVAEAVERDARAVGMTQRPWSCSIGPGGVIFSTVRRSALPDTGYPAGREDDTSCDETSELQSDFSDPRVEDLLARLEASRRNRDPAGIPEIFRSLVHQSKDVRESAKLAARSIGWEKAAATILALARRGAVSQMRAVLDGLGAFESHGDVVTLLDRLVNLLKGDLRNQAILLLERKRLVLDMEKTIAVFRTLRSPYRISRVLGQGLFTSSYTARDEEDGLDVVVRVLRAEWAAQPQIRTRFLDLSHQSRRFVHQNLVLTREVRSFPEHDLYFVVRDHVDGVTLQSLIDPDKPFSAQQVASILRQVIAALEPIHRSRQVHGGIKPSNVFLTESHHVVVGDIALPAPALGASLERLSYDYRYVAPELFEGTGVAGPAADFYALGCVAHELICGRPPFVADNPFQLAGMHLHESPPVFARNDLSPSIAAFILKLVAKATAERYADADEILRDLRLLAGSGETSTQAPAEPMSARFAIALGHEEARSIVSFDPRTLAPSSTSVLGNLPIHQKHMPRQLGRYEILRTLGQGGMGTVYLARDVALERQVALKVFAGNSAGGTSHLERFRQEARAVAQLNHPGIMRIFDVGDHDGVFYLTLEYVGGGSLSQLLRAQGPIAPARAAQIVLQLAHAVQTAHDQGIIHRDLKPSNVLLTENGAPKIADFGLVKLVDKIDDENLGMTMPGEMLGTPGYMAPEQVRGEVDKIGPATDVYGLGVILYESLTGRRPFQGPVFAVLHQISAQSPTPPRQWNSNIPIALDAICLKCLEKAPERRYTSAAALAADLEHLLAGKMLTVPQPRSGVWNRLRRLFSYRKS